MSASILSSLSSMFASSASSVDPCDDFMGLSAETVLSLLGVSSFDRVVSVEVDSLEDEDLLEEMEPFEVSRVDGMAWAVQYEIEGRVFVLVGEMGFTVLLAVRP